MHSSLLVVALAWAGLQTPQELDEITLTDGRVMLGHIEDEREESILFREVRLQGRITSVHEFPRERVQAIRRAVRQAGAEGAGLDTAAIVIEDPPGSLREIVEEYRVHNLKSAASKLVPLMQHASARHLPALEQICRENLDWSLSRFAAEVQLAYSLQRAENGYFRLYYLTRESLDELLGLLAEARDAALVENLCCGQDAQSGTCQRLDWVAQWLDRPQEYDGRGECATAFARQITRLMGMTRELVRLSRILGAEAQRIQYFSSEIARLRKLHAAVYRRRGMPQAGSPDRGDDAGDQ